MPEHVLITGASGLIGTRLTQLLQEKGYAVSHLGRSKKSGPVKSYTWNVERGEIDREALAAADHVIHLAGAAVTEKRLTEARKRLVISSRVDSTRLLADAIAGQAKKPKSFISASAVGYYGMVTTDHIFTESDPPADDFLGECCRLWENAAQPIAASGVRTAFVRVGIVLSNEGGALKQLAAPVRWFAGAPMGSGKQWMPWIHIEDICGIFLHLLEDARLQGPWNAVAPNPVTNKTLTQCIARALGRPLILPPVPGFALRLLLGKEMAAMVLNGSRVSCEKIQQAGYRFQFADAEKAAEDLLK